MFRSLLAVTIALSASLLSQQAHAYVVKGAGWKQDSVTFHVDPQLDQAIPGGRAAVGNAVGTWSAEGDIPRIDLRDETGSVPRDTRDDENVISVYQDGWPFDSNLLAATVTMRSNLDRRLLSADIYVNAQHHHFGEGGFDLQSTLTHEVGHALDLGDEDHALAAAMYRRLAAGVVKHAINDDDRNGIAEIYGSGPNAVGCAQGGVKSVLPALLAVAVIALRRRRGIAVALLALFASFQSAEADSDGALLALADVDGVASVVRGSVVDAVTIAQPGAPLPMTELTLSNGSCVAGACASVQKVRVWGGVREDGVLVELADQPVPEAGEEIVVRVDAAGRSVQRHGATIAFMGRDVLNRTVVTVGDRLAWSQHRWEDVTTVFEQALGVARR